MNRVGYSIVLLFTCVLGLYFYPFNQSTTLTDDVSTQTLFETPTYRAENLTSKLYAQDGKLSHEVFATVMEHYETLGFMVFEQPLYTIYVDAGQPYKISADEGTLFTNNIVRLEKNIVIKSLNQSDFIQQITTDFIEIDLTTNTLYSDSEVRMTGAEFSMLSKGLNGDMQAKKFNLTGHVKTVFASSTAQIRE